MSGSDDGEPKTMEFPTIGCQEKIAAELGETNQKEKDMN